MALTKFASAEVLDVKGSPERQRTASLNKISDYENYRTSDGYMYVRLRAISSRVNKNNDGWPSVELAGSKEIFDRHAKQSSTGGFTLTAAEGNPEYGFATFMGKPVFVDHHNSNPKRARGVIVDAKLNVLPQDHKESSFDPYYSSDDVDPEHLPPTEVELLLEIDAKEFPKLAKAIQDGDIDGFSMGCDVDRSKCSHCGQEATSPDEYCSHLVMKGATLDFVDSKTGKRTSKKSYENCYGIKFFEISAVFDPADPTALAREIRASVKKEADVHEAILENALGPGGAPDPVRTNDQEVEKRVAWLIEHKGFDYNTALDVVTRQMQPGAQTPGFGEGANPQIQRTQYMPSDANGMPGGGGLNGFPPPVRPEVNVGGPQGFAPAAEEALNEQWPHRPVQNDARWSHAASTHTAENPLPQSDHMSAPEEVDTLRKERICPVCGSDMDGETCDVCGFVEPPQGFDNPDLQKAKQNDELVDEGDELVIPADEASGSINEEEGSQGRSDEATKQPGSWLQNQKANKSVATSSVTVDMRDWTPIITRKAAAVINQQERPIKTTSKPVPNEPTDETVTSDQTKPVTAAMRTAQQLIEAAKRNNPGDNMSTSRVAAEPTDPSGRPDKRVDVEAIGGVDEASNEQASRPEGPRGQPGKQVDVEGIGSTGVEDVEADEHTSLPTAGRESDDSGFDKSKTVTDSGPTKTFDNSNEPGSAVTDKKPYWVEESDWDKATYRSNTEHTAYDDGVFPHNEEALDGGAAKQGVKPNGGADVQPERRVNVKEHVTSPANNSGPTKQWTGTDGNGVTRQQDPVTKELVWNNTDSAWKSSHFITALKLADTEVEMGLISKDAKYERIAQLEQWDPAVVQASLTTLARVKTAGLTRTAKTAHRLPSFKNVTASEESAPTPVDDSTLDSALFTR